MVLSDNVRTMDRVSDQVARMLPPGYVDCTPRREKVPNAKVKYNSTIVMRLNGDPPFELYLNRKRGGMIWCGYLFDNRSSVQRPEPFPGKTETTKVLLQNTTEYSFNPSEWASYGQGVLDLKVGDAIVFGAERKQDNQTGRATEVYASTNFTLVENEWEEGIWTPPGSSARLTKSQSLKALALFGLIAITAVLV